MQDLPGAPGTARQGRTGTSVPTDSGGVATQPRAPSHERPLAAQRAAGHGWLSAALEAPGDDEPLTTTARAPGHNCLSAVPRTPGHGRPLAAQRAAGRDRLRVAFGAPGADVPLATTAGAPGHHRLSATQPAPGADAPLATTAGAPGHHRLSAAPIATAALPASVRRLLQAVLPRVPANPRTPIYLHSHRLNRHSCFPPRHSRESGNPRPPVATGGPQGGYAPATCVAYSQTPTRLQSRSTTHQVHPAVQVPPHPRSCSTACTGFSPQRQSRAPPCTGRGHISSPGACSGGGRGRGPPTAPLSPRERAGVRAALPTALTPLPCEGRGRGLGSPYSPSPHGGEGAGG